MKIFATTFLVVLITTLAFSQKIVNTKMPKVVYPNTIKKPIGFSISAPLRDAPKVITGIDAGEEFYMNDHRDRILDPNIFPPDFRSMPPDPGEQTEMGSVQSGRGLDKNYAGQSSGSYPPDCNGTVGPNHYFQVVNTTYQIFNKSDGSSAAGPSDLNTIFDPSLPGVEFNNGDPIVLWDEQANRWFYAEFSLGTPPNYPENDFMLIAVSTTDDPTGTWYSWSYDVDDTPDYMKFGIWEDGYYMATNTSGGNDIYVFERSVMIAGGTNPTMVGFDNPDRPSTFDGFHCLLPLDNDGPWAPAGTPGQFITIADDGQSNPADELRIYELNVDWVTPSNSTFSMVQQLGVNAFSGNFTGDWNNIPQPGTTQKLDGISTVLMYRAQYRNNGGTQKIVCTHTIAESSTEAAIRWYELENTGSNWSIVQQGTYNPDNISRWNASIAMNDAGQIGMGYSVSDGSSIYPGIRYCGQTAGATPGIMDVAEANIWTGANSQSSYNRWGDYSNISIDPSDGTTFWYTNEYQGSSSHDTRVAAFSFAPPCTGPATQASSFFVTTINDNDFTINWVRGDGTDVLVVAREGSAVNQDPSSGISYTADADFGLGDEIGSGNFTVYNGTGTSVTVSSLNPGTTYHFSIYEYNSTQTCYTSPGLTGNGTTTGTSPCSPCVSNGNTSWETSTTFVGINTLSNSSGKPSGYSDYTAISTGLEVGSSHTLNVRVNTDGNYTVHTIAWIDWNNDCDFLDPGEEFDLGTASNVADGATSLSPLVLSVPVNAMLGNTVMRVSTKYSSDPTSCEINYDGEVEDYTITILPATTTWNGTNTNWNDPANWPNGVVPNSSYEVTIPAVPVNGEFPVIQSGTVAVCYSITLESGATITINGTLREEK